MDKNKSILLIEDDVAIREILQEILEQEGYGVLCASNGADGLELLKDNPQICLVLLDLFMPIMSGPEFLQALRKENPPIVASLSIVVLSASPPDGEVVRSVKPITQGFIKKPVDLDGLLSTVEKFGCRRAA